MAFSRFSLSPVLFASLLAGSMAVALTSTAAAQLSLPVETMAPATQGTPTLEPDASVQAPVQAKAVVVDIVSNELDYDDKTGLYTASGDVKVVVSEQNTELLADKISYDPVRELVVAEGNVVISDGPEKVYGTYAKIDLTRNSALINDPITVLDQVRIKAREGFKDGKFTKLVDGKLVIPGQTQAALKQDDFSDLIPDDLSKLATSDPFITNRNSGTADEATDPTANTKSAQAVNANNPNTYGNAKVLDELDMRWDAPAENPSYLDRKLRWHAKEVDVVRHGDWDDINVKWPSLKFGGMTIARMPQMDFAQDGLSEDIEYLGPDIGIDPDHGGFYAGPGLDFRAGDGFVRFSPYISMGAGRRRSRSGQDLESVSGFGGGAMVHYMSHKTNASAGYNFLVGTPTILVNRKIGDGKTRLILSANEDYDHGMFGWERPRYGGQLTDTRMLARKGGFALRSFFSAGAMHDEFFPTNNADFFVERPSKKPVTAGRAQAQFQLSSRPLLDIGDRKNNLKVAVRAQAGLSAYSTGDFYSVVRGGPQVRLRLFNRFSSINQYYYAATNGDSPFVFDTYFAGRNSVQTTNQVYINKFLTMGMRTQISVNKDNARNDMLLGNQIFVLFGPEDVKFNLAYDVVRQRSFFGINFMPGKKRKTLYYDEMNIQDAVDYDGPPPLTPAVSPTGVATDAFGNVKDVGMMNGNKAN